MIKFNDNNTIKIDPPVSTLKLSGTRFGTVLGINPYGTPFQVWAEVTKLYKKPFEETKFTRAGKAIESKQAEFVRQKYNLGNQIVSPTDIYGENYFMKTFGDFYPDTKIFGGMWDYLYLDKNGDCKTVLEMKTTQAKKKAEWSKSLPAYYVLQAALYSYLKGIDDCLMVATFLEPEQYDEPENVELNDDNTKLVPFKISKALPKFKEFYVDPATDWWNKYVLTGLSPKYDPSNPDDMAIVNKLKEQEKANMIEQTNLFGFRV